MYRFKNNKSFVMVNNSLFLKISYIFRFSTLQPRYHKTDELVVCEKAEFFKTHNEL